MHLTWQQGMTFDGQTARFDGDVQARTATQLAMAPMMEATLRPRIDFAAPASEDQPEITRLFLDGGVYLKNSALDERGEQLSLDQMNVPNLTVDQVMGKLQSQGPGWVSTVRRQNVPGGAPALPAAPQNAGGPPADNQPLTSIHVAFDGGIQGDLDKHTIQFRQGVRTTYSPARDFTEMVVARMGQPLDQIGPRAVLMTSHTLTLTQMGLPHQSQWFEMMASGNVKVEGSPFTALATAVSYGSDKEAIVLSGEGYADAELWYTPTPGAQQSHAKARKFTYWLRDGMLKAEGLTQGDAWLPGTLRLRGR
jgi:hypothetical protein